MPTIGTSKYEERPEARRAYKKVEWALHSGALVRPISCAECGSGGRIEASHDDYAKPLDVVWLCQPCHRRKDFNRPDVVARREAAKAARRMQTPTCPDCQLKPVVCKGRCKGCYERIRQQADPEYHRARARENARRWRARNPERARAIGARADAKRRGKVEV